MMPEAPGAAAPVIARSRVPGRFRMLLHRLELVWARLRGAGATAENVSTNVTGSGAHVLMLNGEINAWCAEEVADQIHDALKAPDPNLVVDLRGVRALDSSVLAALVIGLREARARGSAFVLVRPDPVVWRVFDVTGLSADFPSFGSLRAALDSIPARQPDVVAHQLQGERRERQFTARQERALAALYWTGAFDPDRGQPVHALVKSGYLTDSRYAGPLTALADQGLVENRHELLGRNWSGTTTWWLTEEGRQTAREFL
jgi:anti-anti-sigma factor